MALREGWTRRSGPVVRYLDNRPAAPRGLPVLFSPGLSDRADEYVEILEDLLPRRLLVVEVRGRGRSEAPPSGYTAADHAADLRAVLDEEGVERFHLMTFSRGTTWGLDLALSAPDRVASVSIADYRAVEVGLPPSFADAQHRTRFRGVAMAERLPRHVLDGVVGASVHRELWEGLGALPCPVMLARPGGDGGVLTDADVARYRRARPDVEVVVVPGAPHDVFRPDRLFYARAVADFTGRAEARRGR